MLRFEETGPAPMLLVDEPEKEVPQETESAMDERIDEMVMRTYDRAHRFPGDARDKATRVKTTGFVDLEKFNDWRSALKRSMHRRRRMQRGRGQSDTAGATEVAIT